MIAEVLGWSFKELNAKVIDEVGDLIEGNQQVDGIRVEMVVMKIVSCNVQGFGWGLKESFRQNGYRFDQGQVGGFAGDKVTYDG